MKNMDANTRRRGVIKRDQVRLDERREAAPAGPAAGARSERPAARARLLTLDEHTQAIELVCSCGEVSLIEIRCEKKP